MSYVKNTALGIIIVLLCVIFQIAHADFFVPSGIIVAEENDLQRDTAIEIAIKTAVHNYGVDEEEIKNATITTYFVQADIDGRMEHVWMVKFCGGFFSIINVNILSPEGQILDATNSVSLKEATDSWVKKKGQDYFWSIEDKELFFNMYSGTGIGDVISLPSEEDIPQDSALGLAKKHIAENTNLDVNAIDSLVVSTTFWRTTDSPSADHWSFCFHDPDALDSGEESRLYQIDILSQDGSVIQFNNIVEDGMGNG